MFTVNGGINDVVDLSAAFGGGAMVQTGVANGFSADGSAGAGYSKYAGTYTDLSGNNYQVELLLQNGITAI
jgi:hypothetical protein